MEGHNGPIMRGATVSAGYACGSAGQFGRDGRQIILQVLHYYSGGGMLRATPPFGEGGEPR